MYIYIPLLSLSLPPSLPPCLPPSLLFLVFPFYRFDSAVYN